MSYLPKRNGFSRIGLACVLLTAILMGGSAVVSGQRKKTPKVATQPKVNELARLRDQYVEATREYKQSLARLLALYEKEVTKAEENHKKSEALFEEGLISKKDLETTAIAVVAAKDKVAEAQQQMSTADTQIANTLIEAEAEKKLAKLKIQRGALVKTTSYIRYAGGTAWTLSESWKVQRFFMDTFKKTLPVAVFGQGAIHERWRLDHRNSMDISLHPDGVEGQALLNFLRSNGIPFLAFRSAIPGTSTGPHIHIGRPSHRY